LRPQDEYQGLVHADSSGYILHIYQRAGKGLLNISGRQLILEKYDPDFNQVFSYEYGEKGEISVELVSLKSKLIWIVLEKSGAYNYTYSMIPIGLDGKEGKKTKLFDTDIEKAIDIPYTYIELSPDSSSVAFIAEFDSKRKRRTAELYSAVIDHSGMILWDKFTALPGKANQYDFLDYGLSPDNEVLLLSKYSKDASYDSSVKNKRGEPVAGYGLYLYSINADSKKANRTSIETEDAFIRDASIWVDRLGGVNCVSLFSNKERGNISGFGFASLDPAHNLIHNSVNKYDINDLIELDKANASVNIKKQSKLGLDGDFELLDLIPLEEGYLVPLEQNYLQTLVDQINDPFNPVGIRRRRNETTYLHSNDIVLMKLSAAGELENIDLISKKQVNFVQNSQLSFNLDEDRLRERNFYLSHNYMVTNDDIYFFYNDDRDNLKKAKRRRQIQNTRRMESAMATLNDDLSYSLNSLLGREAEMLIAPPRSKQLDASTYFVTMVPKFLGRRTYICIGVMRFE